MKEKNYKFKIKDLRDKLQKIQKKFQVFSSLKSDKEEKIVEENIESFSKIAHDVVSNLSQRDIHLFIKAIEVESFKKYLGKDMTDHLSYTNFYTLKFNKKLIDEGYRLPHWNVLYETQKDNETDEIQIRNLMYVFNYPPTSFYVSKYAHEEFFFIEYEFNSKIMDDILIIDFEQNRIGIKSRYHSKWVDLLRQIIGRKWVEPFNYVPIESYDELFNKMEQICKLNPVEFASFEFLNEIKNHLMPILGKRTGFLIKDFEQSKNINGQILL